MGTSCCKREVNNTDIIAVDDRLIINSRGRTQNGIIINEFKEDPASILPLYSLGQETHESLVYAKDHQRKKSNMRGRDGRLKKPLAGKNGRAGRGLAMQKKGGTVNFATSGMTAGHKYRKNNHQLASLPYGETEENFESEDGEGDPDSLPSRGFK